MERPCTQPLYKDEFYQSKCSQPVPELYNIQVYNLCVLVGMLICMNLLFQSKMQASIIWALILLLWLFCLTLEKVYTHLDRLERDL